MRKHLIRAAAVGAVLALLVAASALAKPHVIRAGNLFLKDNGGISPSQLPKHSQAPISAHIDAEIGTTDGSHPPAVEDPEHRLRQEHPGQRQGPARLQEGPARSALDRGREEGLPRRDRRLRRRRSRSRLPRTGAVHRQGPDRPLQRRRPRRHHASLRPHLRRRPGADRRHRHGQDHPHPPRPLRHPHRLADPGDRRRRRLGHQVQADHRPQIHLQGQEGELPDRQLPDRDLLHRRQHPLRRRHHAPGHPHPALHAEGLAGQQGHRQR